MKRISNLRKCNVWISLSLPSFQGRLHISLVVGTNFWLFRCK